MSQDKSFLERVFTKEELKYSFSKKNPFKHLAGRFAAKEACMKALGTGWSKGVDWKDIEVVVKQEGGNPQIVVYSETKKFLNKRNISLSISCSKDYAVAWVVIF